MTHTNPICRGVQVGLYIYLHWVLTLLTDDSLPMKDYQQRTGMILHINTERQPLEIHATSFAALFYSIPIPEE